MFLILCDCVVAHDPASKFAFRDEADAITDALTDLGINLYHIGQHRDSGHFDQTSCINVFIELFALVV